MPPKANAQSPRTAAQAHMPPFQALGAGHSLVTRSIIFSKS